MTGRNAISLLEFGEPSSPEYADALRLAIDALKAQEPRLVIETDFENADGYNYIPAWCEERIGGAGYWEMITSGALEEEDFRYWTSKPSLKQMEETPWN